jgi:hypothetical protein
MAYMQTIWIHSKIKYEFCLQLDGAMGDYAQNFIYVVI